MKKYLSIVLIALLLLCSQTSCAKPLPKPGEIFAEIEAAGSVRVEIFINFSDVTTYTTVIEQEEDKTFVSQRSETFGAVTGEEYYTATQDEQRYVYTQDSDDNWIRKKLHQIEQTATFEGLRPLFNDSIYVLKDGKYVMGITSALEIDGMLYNNAVIERGDDGLYKITASVEQETETLPISGIATITFSKIGDVTVTLPEVK